MPSPAGGARRSTPQAFPADAAFVAGGDYAPGPGQRSPASTRCMSDFNSKLATLARAATPRRCSPSSQKNGDAALKGN